MGSIFLSISFRMKHTLREMLVIRDCRDSPVDTQEAFAKHPMLSQVPSKTRKLFVDSATIVLKHYSPLVESDCSLENEVRASDQE